MNAFERIKNLVTKKLWSQAPSLASSELLGLYHTNPRLDGARIIAQKCASTELYLYDRADYRKNKNNAEIIETHELYDLLDDPCPTFRELSGWTVRYFVFACYTLVGEAYLLKVRKPNGNVAGLLPIAPSWVVKTPTAGAEYWEIYPFGTMGGNSVVVPINDVQTVKSVVAHAVIQIGCDDLQKAFLPLHRKHGVCFDRQRNLVFPQLFVGQRFKIADQFL